MDGTGELSINEMSTGMSASGMEQYLENIKAEILTNVSEKLVQQEMRLSSH